MNSKIGAVVLAAGTSSRAGEINKLLFDYKGAPLVVHVVQTLLSSDLSDITVVTGHEHELVTEALSQLPVKTVFNSRFADGMASSLQTGLSTLKEYDGAIVCLADMPHIKRNTINRLIKSYSDNPGKQYYVPNLGGRRGNPVLLAQPCFDDVLNLSGDQGAKQLFDRYPERLQSVETDDEGILTDYDSSLDLQKLV